MRTRAASGATARLAAAPTSVCRRRFPDRHQLATASTPCSRYFRAVRPAPGMAADMRDSRSAGGIPLGVQLWDPEEERLWDPEEEPDCADGRQAGSTTCRASTRPDAGGWSPRSTSGSRSMSPGQTMVSNSRSKLTASKTSRSSRIATPPACSSPPDRPRVPPRHQRPGEASAPRAAQRGAVRRRSCPHHQRTRIDALLDKEEPFTPR